MIPDTLVVCRGGALRGEITVPGDKSVSHRAIILGALARGETRIGNFLRGEDCRATLDIFRRLGTEVEETAGEDVITVRGAGLNGLVEPDDVLDCGNSGTSMRLIAGVLAGLPFFSVLNGDASLRGRPMDRVITPLRLMGAEVRGRAGDCLPPLVIQGGGIKGIQYNPPVASAQVKSCVLLAGLFAQGETTVEETSPSRDHTERMLAYFGAEIERRDERTVTLRPGRPLEGRTVAVPGDISSAAFFLVAGAVVPGSDIVIKGVGVNPSRAGVLEVLGDMGADLEIGPVSEADGGEPMADIRVRHSALKGATISGALIPRLVDEIPALCVAAALAEGTTVIKDAADLRHKESDRISSMVTGLGALGADIEPYVAAGRVEGLVVRGGASLKGAAVDSHGDHRLAMALAVAGLAAEGETRISGARSIGTSFPQFSALLKKVSK